MVFCIQIRELAANLSLWLGATPDGLLVMGGGGVVTEVVGWSVVTRYGECRSPQLTYPLPPTLTCTEKQA